MSSDDSMALLIDRIKNGDEEAARTLWDRYFPQLVGFARQKLAGQQRRIADEDDVVQSALASFFRGAEHGRFPNLRDRDDLWRLLSVMTYRKAVDLIHHNERQKRNALGESALAGSNSEFDNQGFAGIEGDDLPPDIKTILKEGFQRLLDLLDPDLQDLVLKKLALYTNKEIAGQLDCSVATVERRLQLIRKIWESELPP